MSIFSGRKTLMHEILCHLEDILLQTKDETTKRKLCFLGEQLQQVLVRGSGHRFSDRTMDFCVKFSNISKLLYKEIVYQDLLCLPTPHHVSRYVVR